MIKTTLLLLMTSCLAFSQTANNLTAHSGLKVSLSANLEECEFGDELVLILRLKNTTDKDITLYLPAEYDTNTHLNGIQDGSFIKVTNQDGEEVAQHKFSFGGLNMGCILDEFVRVPKQSETELNIALLPVQKDTGRNGKVTKGGEPFMEGQYMTFGSYTGNSSTLRGIPYTKGTSLKFQLHYANKVTEAVGNSAAPNGTLNEKKEPEPGHVNLDESAKETFNFWAQRLNKKFDNLWTGELVSNAIEIKLR